MNTERFQAKDKEVTMYLSETPDCPLIFLNVFSGDGSAVADELIRMKETDFNLVCVGNLNWDHDMSPWYCPPLFPKAGAYTGGADDHLEFLISEILPRAKSMVKGTPSHTGIAGYSLAGLFALYALYRTDVFDRAASMSGSLWYPGFRDYCMEHTMVRRPDKIYLSLGDREAKTRNEVLRTVQTDTESIQEYYKSLGLDVTWELNPGSHFREPELRSAKGVLAVIRG